jgi:hypothetical protein
MQKPEEVERYIQAVHTEIDLVIKRLESEKKNRSDPLWRRNTNCSSCSLFERIERSFAFGFRMYRATGESLSNAIRVCG